MATVFAEDIATADELITLYGEACGWRKAAADAGGGVLGYPEPEESADSVPCKIAWFSPRDLGRGTAEFIALLMGIEVPAGKQVGLLAGNAPFSPEAADTVIRRDGREIGVDKVDFLGPDGTPVLYYVTVSL